MRRSFYKACYNGTLAEWNRYESYFDANGDVGMTETIRRVINSQKALRPKISSFPTVDDYGVAFRDGAIAKMDAAMSALESGDE